MTALSGIAETETLSPSSTRSDPGGAKTMTADLAGLFEAVWRKAYNQGVRDANRTVEWYLKHPSNYHSDEVVKVLEHIFEHNKTYLKSELPKDST